MHSGKMILEMLNARLAPRCIGDKGMQAGLDLELRDEIDVCAF